MVEYFTYFEIVKKIAEHSSLADLLKEELKKPGIIDLHIDSIIIIKDLENELYLLNDKNNSGINVLELIYKEGEKPTTEFFNRFFIYNQAQWTLIEAKENSISRSEIKDIKERHKRQEMMRYREALAETEEQRRHEEIAREDDF